MDACLVLKNKDVSLGLDKVNKKTHMISTACKMKVVYYMNMINTEA